MKLADIRGLGFEMEDWLVAGLFYYKEVAVWLRKLAMLMWPRDK